MFVDPRGVYATLPGVDPWGPEREARDYPGPYPVVAHPPCARWGWHARALSTEAAGYDGGRFYAAWSVVRRWGGILEHPASSLAWTEFGLQRPGGWGWTRGPVTRAGAVWACAVDQGHYGHPAPKRSWLLLVTRTWADGPPPALRWEPSGASGRVQGMADKRDREATPAPFARLLLGLATGDPARWATGDLGDRSTGDLIEAATGDLDVGTGQRCEVCGAAVERARHGPPRRLCSDRCKQRASRQARVVSRAAFVL